MEIITIRVRNSIDVNKVIALLQKSKIDLEFDKEQAILIDTVSKQAFLNDLKEGLQEVADIKNGKKKGKTLNEFLEYVK